MAFNKEIAFLKSALTEENPFLSTEGIAAWIREKNAAVHVDIERVPFQQLERWYIEPETQNLRHSSGRFFSIEGISVSTNWGHVPQWMQPIIHQPEIGFLGIITKEINGILYFLMQAKIEPGNVNNVQISPTLQATKSNYTQIHQGNKPLYLEYFLDRSHPVLLDQLQSEQGGRFLRKRNRNIIIMVNEDIPLYDNFCWLTLGQIKKLIEQDNTINMDTRTVISGIPFGQYTDDTLGAIEALLGKAPATQQGELGRNLMLSTLRKRGEKHSMEEILSWLTQLKTLYELSVDVIPLKDVQGWQHTPDSIEHHEQKYFRVIGVRVTISNREVSSWFQPLVEPMQEGICAFVMKKINGVYHFLVQAKLECGNFDIVELAPTVQCLTGNYRNAAEKPPYLDYVLNAKPEQFRHNSLQSEEGGRFYHEQNRHILIEADDDFSENVPENYIWMTVQQLKTFIRFNNYLNIQSRSLLSAINFA